MLAASLAPIKIMCPGTQLPFGVVNSKRSRAWKLLLNTGIKGEANWCTSQECMHFTALHRRAQCFHPHSNSTALLAIKLTAPKKMSSRDADRALAEQRGAAAAAAAAPRRVPRPKRPLSAFNVSSLGGY